LTAALIIAFIIGCNDSLDNVKSEKAEFTPDGKVLVRLNLVDSKGRTILPTTSGFTFPTNVDHFTLVVKNPTNVTQLLPSALSGDITGGSAGVTLITGTPIPLAPEVRYTFTLTAFSGATAAVAVGIKEYDVDSSNHTLSIVLKEIIDGVGTGVLDVTGIPGYDTADLTFAPLSPGGTPLFTYDLNTDGSGTSFSGPVKSGYYKMTIALTKAYHEPANIVEVVYIYQNFTTSFAGPYPTLRSNRYQIIYNGGPLYSGMASEYVNHGAFIQNLPPTTAISPSSGTDIFGGWYTTNVPANQVSANRIFSTTKIIKAQNLYIRWEPASVNVNVSGITNTWSGGGVAPTLSASANYSQANATITVTITIDNASQFTTFEWYKDGTVIAGQTGSTLTITEAQADASSWYQQGTHTIQLFATDKDTLMRQSGSTTIDCLP